MTIPKDPTEFRRYVNEMLAEMIEHYSIAIPLAEIEAHVQIELEPCLDGRFVTYYTARTDAGLELLKCMDEEDRYIDAELSAGRQPVQRDWTWKWQ
jgi:hypothetical protein